MHAQIRNGQIVNLIGSSQAGPEDLPVVGVLPPHSPPEQFVRENPPEQWIVGDTQVERTYTVHTRSLEQEKVRVCRSIRAMRQQVEKGGMTITLPDATQIFVRTDETSQSKIQGAQKFLERNPTELVDWESMPGQWAQIDQTTIDLIADTLGFHVQSAFSRQKQLEEQCMAAQSLSELFSLDIKSGWTTEYTA